jgi:hypothetical protein
VGNQLKREEEEKQINKKKRKRKVKRKRICGLLYLETDFVRGDGRIAAHGVSGCHGGGVNFGVGVVGRWRRVEPSSSIVHLQPVEDGGAVYQISSDGAQPANIAGKKWLQRHLRGKEGRKEAKHSIRYLGACFFFLFFSLSVCRETRIVVAQKADGIKNKPPPLPLLFTLLSLSTHSVDIHTHMEEAHPSCISERLSNSQPPK